MRFLALLLVMTGCGLQAVDEQVALPGPDPVAPVSPEVTPALVPGSMQRPVKDPVRTVPLRSGEFEHTLKDATTQIELLLNGDTVFCSALGYGASFLKVSVPDLDSLAVFDHRVDVLGLPCAAAGQCTDVLGPETILQSRPGLESVALRVTLIEVLSVDVKAQTCTRSLREDVATVVRGVPLRHRVQVELENVPFETCRVLATLRQ